MSTQEAMDTAQVAQNLADGRGYTTYFVRPFSMYLVKQRNDARAAAGNVGTIPTIISLRTPCTRIWPIRHCIP